MSLILSSFLQHGRAHKVNRRMIYFISWLLVLHFQVFSRIETLPMPLGRNFPYRFLVLDEINGSHFIAISATFPVFLGWRQMVISHLVSERFSVVVLTYYFVSIQISLSS